MACGIVNINVKIEKIMKKNKAVRIKKSAEAGVIDYAQVLSSIEGVSQLKIVEPLEAEKWGEYKFIYSETDVYFSIIEAKTFNTFRLANFFDFSSHMDKLKDDLDSLIYNFNIRSVGYKCYRGSKKSSIVIFCSEFLFMDNVITEANIQANLALITAFPESFLKVDEK